MVYTEQEQQAHEYLMKKLNQNRLQKAIHQVFGKLPTCVYDPSQYDYAYVVERFEKDPQYRTEITEKLKPKLNPEPKETTPEMQRTQEFWNVLMTRRIEDLT